VTQKGSEVRDDGMRFDFSHPKAMTPEEIAKVEDEVNERIRGNAEVVTRLMTPDEAVTAGALALFGEKYGDEVRVVSMGEDDPGGKPHFSTELCGGTHVRRTGDIGLFKIVSEGAVGAGVRRIEVVTGPGAEAYVREEEKALRAVANTLKAGPAEAAQRIQALLDERKKLERELADARRALAMGGGSAARNEGREVGGVTFVAKNVGEVSPKELKGVADELKKKVGSGVIAITSVDHGKANVVVGVTSDLVGKYNAVDFVRIGAKTLGGTGGGGRPEMAQGGGPNVGALDEALKAIEEHLANVRK